MAMMGSLVDDYDIEAFFAEAEQGQATSPATEDAELGVPFAVVPDDQSRAPPSTESGIGMFDYSAALDKISAITLDSVGPTGTGTNVGTFSWPDEESCSKKGWTIVRGGSCHGAGRCRRRLSQVQKSKSSYSTFTASCTCSCNINISSQQLRAKSK